MSRRTTVFSLFTAAYFFSYFYRSANAIIAGDLARELDLNAGQLGLLTSLFFAAFAAIQLPMGVWLDRWGSRWVTPSLMFIGALGSLLFALAPNLALIGDWTRADRRRHGRCADGISQNFQPVV